MKNIIALLLLAGAVNQAVAEDYTDPTCAGLTLNVFPVDVNGWTVLPSITQPGRRIIYVSSKNTIHNNGTIFWVQTSEQATALLRVGMPDSLLFNRGEVFHLAASIDSRGLAGGSTPDQVKVLGAYGSGPRPVIMWNQPHSLIAVEGYGVKNLIITQLDLQPDPTLTKWGVGITIFPNGNVADNANILIEDVRVQGFSNNFDIENTTNFTLRRSEVLDACGNFRSQGMYLATNNGIKLEENFFDDNGIAACGKPGVGSPQAQGIYNQIDNHCSRFFGNVITRSLGTGLQARTGGVVQNNLFAADNTSMTWGSCNGGCSEGKVLPLGVTGQITGNLFIGGQLLLGNVKKVLVQSNIFLNDPQGAQLNLVTNNGIGLHGLNIDQNTFVNSKYPLTINGPATFGTLVAYNDGTKNKIILWSTAWNKPGTYSNQYGVPVFQFVDMFKKVWSNGSSTLYPEGWELNGCDLFLNGVKVISSAGNGVACPAPNPHLTFSGADSFTNNIIQGAWRPIEFSQTSTNVTSLPVAQAFFKDFALSGNIWGGQPADPAFKAAPVTWDPKSVVAVISFVNPAAALPANYIDLVRAQTRENWNDAIMAKNMNAMFQAAFKKK